MSQKSNNYKIATIALIGTVIILAIAIGIIEYTLTLHSTGTVDIRTVNCSVWYNQQATQQATAINWGNLPPNSAVNVTIYIRNDGNTSVNYTISVSNWSPASAPNYISLTYDLHGAQNIAPNQVISCTLTDAIAPNITGITTYSYDITITATG
jgi:hypothetical protein